MSFSSNDSFGSSQSLLSVVKSNSIELLHNILTNTNGSNQNGSNISVSYSNSTAKVQTNDTVCAININIDERDSRGRTALHLSSIRGTEEIMRLLLEHGADVSAVDLHGNTPLHYCGHIETIQCLLDYGAEIFTK